MIPGLVAHLWQCTLFAGAAWLITLALRANRAQVRYWVWFTASVKFAIPFSLLVGIGALMPHHATAPPIQPEWVTAFQEFSQPLTLSPVTPQSAIITGATNHGYLAWIALGLWACGFAAIAIAWLRRWGRVQALRNSARAIVVPSQLQVPAIIMSAPDFIEPGVVGILRPVLLLPEGIVERLNQAQLDAVLVHELCHIRRKDNLTASIHMVLQAIFWFHPLTWWIGSHLVDERERACDEEVLRLGCKPSLYAESILMICKLFLSSPLDCVSGVTGSNLKRRIESILRNRRTTRLNRAKKLALGAAALSVLVVPIAMGILNTPAVRAQDVVNWQDAAGGKMAFEVASVKPSPRPTGGRSANYKMTGGPGTNDPSRFACENFDLAALIELAYDIPYFLLSAPSWTADARFDIAAKAPDGTTKEQFRLMQQQLLRERFKLAVHREKKEMPVFELVLAKGGSKLTDAPATESAQENQPAIPNRMNMDAEGFPVLPGGRTAYAIARGHARLRGSGETMEHFASTLAGQLHEPVIDGTNLTGKYDFVLSWLLTDTPSDNDTAQTLFNALPNQLGLTLKRTRGRVDLLIVDHVERMPSEN